jgi:predicted transcriptional regulator
MDTVPDFRRDVLVSIRPVHVSKILKGQKTVELRRRFPELGAKGATAFIYSSSPVRAVVGCARIEHVLKLPVSRIWKEHSDAACISRDEFDAYFSGLAFGFAIVFADVRSLKQTLKAADLLEKFGIVPPQSYRYLTEERASLLIDERFQAVDRHKRRNRARRLSARPAISC